MLSKSGVKYSKSKIRGEKIYIIEGHKIIDEAHTIGSSTRQSFYALPQWIETNKNKISDIEVKKITKAISKEFHCSKHPIKRLR